VGDAQALSTTPPTASIPADPAQLSMVRRDMWLAVVNEFS